MAVLFRNAQVCGLGQVDVRTAGAVVSEVGWGLRPQDERLVDCGGCALLPGLHDHHGHIFAVADGFTSVHCGPPIVRTRDSLAQVLRDATPRHGWIRGVGFDEAVCELDAGTLDAIAPEAGPIRIQHRSGALWVVNSAGARALDLESARLDGVERDAAGRPTGRIWRLDRWLAERIGHATPDLAALSQQLASRGITGVTDATPDLDSTAVRAIVTGGFAQRLVSLGRSHGVAGVGLGPRKIVVPDHDLPSVEQLAAAIHAERPRAVAVHCVTRAALVLTVAALLEVGTLDGDRIEHAAVVPPETLELLARLKLIVVTQPSLIARHGDDYFARSSLSDRDHLWPFRTLLSRGIRVACSSDMPYGDYDPWASVAAAVTRQTRHGNTIGAAEAVSARQALRGYLSPPHDPGGPPRRVGVGERADLVLLDRPLTAALADPAAVLIREVVIDNHPIGDTSN